MDRRNFLRRLAAGAAALAIPEGFELIGGLLRPKRRKVYSFLPGLDWHSPANFTATWGYGCMQSVQVAFTRYAPPSVDAPGGRWEITNVSSVKLSPEEQEAQRTRFTKHLMDTFAHDGYSTAVQKLVAEQDFESAAALRDMERAGRVAEFSHA